MEWLSDQELTAWDNVRSFSGVHINQKVLRNITSELIEARAEIAKLRAALAVSDQYWRGNDISPTDVIVAINAALTPSRHSAGSPIPMDGATRTEPGFDGRPAPLAAPAPDTVAGAANLSHTGEPQ